MDSNIFTQAANWVFAGCMFIGIAIGIYYNVVAVGALAGMGAGFIAHGLINLNSEKKSNNSKNKY